MLGKQTSLEWTVAENDDEWRAVSAGRRLPAEAASLAVRQRRRGAFVICSIVAASLLLGAGGAYRLWQRAQAGLRQIETELQQVVAIEEWARRNGHEQLLVALIDAEAPASWRQQVEESALAIPTNGGSSIVSLQRRELRGEMALVQLILAQGDNQGAQRTYRETRFYRATPTGWRRTAPDARFWGAEETLETPDFVYRYRYRDAETVRAVAAKLDITYRMLRTSLGLPPPNAKLVIDVAVAGASNSPPPLLWTGEMLTVLSPQLITAPVDLSEIEILYQAVALRLVERLVAEAMHHYELDLTSWSIKGALRLWLLGETEGSLAVVTHEMMQWLYLDLQVQVREQKERLPRNYEQICVLHQVWELSPLDLSLPLTCTKADQVRRESKPPPLSLIEPGAPSPIYDEYGQLVDHVRYPHASITLATLFKYVVATHGRDRLPLLLMAYSANDHWETLAPALFGVSAEEFERSWRLFLVEHYGIPRS